MLLLEAAGYLGSLSTVVDPFIVIQGGLDNTRDLALSCQYNRQAFERRWMVTDGGSYAPRKTAGGVDFCEFSGVVVNKQDQLQWRVIWRLYNSKPGYFINVKFQNHMPFTNASFSDADAFNHFFATLKSIP